MPAIPLTPTRSTPAGEAIPSPMHGLIRAVATAVVIVALSLVAVLLLAVRADWWGGFFAASVVSVAAAAASVPVVAWGMCAGLRRPEILTGAYLAAMFARALISLGGASAAILLGSYPRAATLLMVAAYYVGILVAETLVVVRALARSEAKAPAAEKTNNA